MDSQWPQCIILILVTSNRYIAVQPVQMQAKRSIIDKRSKCKNYQSSENGDADDILFMADAEGRIQDIQDKVLK